MIIEKFLLKGKIPEQYLISQDFSENILSRFISSYNGSELDKLLELISRTQAISSMDFLPKSSPNSLYDYPILNLRGPILRNCSLDWLKNSVGIETDLDGRLRSFTKFRDFYIWEKNPKLSCFLFNTYIARSVREAVVPILVNPGSVKFICWCKSVINRNTLEAIIFQDGLKDSKISRLWRCVNY